MQMDIRYHMREMFDVSIRDFCDGFLDLKEVRRQGWVEAGLEHPESVADHSYATAMLAMVMADMDGLDVSRAMRMALLHDMAEGITGDIIPGSMDPAVKRRREKEAMDCIMGAIPSSIRHLYKSAWDEYMAGDTAEARLVHDADKLEMGLQAYRYQNDMDSGTFQSFLESARNGLERGRAAGII